MVRVVNTLAFTATFLVEAEPGLRGIETLARLGEVLAHYNADNETVGGPLDDILLEDGKDNAPRLDLTRDGIRLYVAVWHDDIDPVSKMRRIFNHLEKLGFKVNPAAGG